MQRQNRQTRKKERRCLPGKKHQSKKADRSAVKTTNNNFKSQLADSRTKIHFTLINILKHDKTAISLFLFFFIL